MAKGTAIRHSITGRIIGKGSSSGDLQSFRALAQELKNNPDKLRELIMRAGITTPTGQLRKGYREK